MTEQEYLNYLKRYSSDFKVTKDDGGMSIIKGKYGQIEPHGKDTCQVWFRNLLESIPPLSTKRLIKLKEASTPYLSTYLNLTGEGIGVFMEDYVPQMAQIVGAKRRRKMTEEQKTVFRQRMIKSKEKL